VSARAAPVRKKRMLCVGWGGRCFACGGGGRGGRAPRRAGRGRAAVLRRCPVCRGRGRAFVVESSDGRTGLHEGRS
jgi:hypothetical protein